MAGKKVCIVGSGNWGSAIAKIVGSNAARLAHFDPRVTMWVFEEDIGGRKLTEIINTQHENVKYLPGHKLPPNVVAIPDVVQAATGADILIFVVPHQFIGKICDQLKGHLKANTIGISLIKGVDEGPKGLKLISEVIGERLGIPMSVLMGANIASEVAEEKFCETTIGCKDVAQGQLLKELMQTPNFRVTVVQEVDTVEICGALKWLRVLGHLPGELWCCRPHHYLLRRAEPQGGRGLRSHWKVYRAAGERDAEWAEAPGAPDSQGATQHPSTQGPREQVPLVHGCVQSVLRRAARG
ncbi:glycerol-3-phosphate dehydrogenase [NAD(+)], cytoplasmic isoform X2 [Microtus ochrogaster]|uniref:Glycerol-3-phosphate dehydrogenase [NAD(+)], cytoplasmic isoform X2 n=1 Tax=Microtus ochrogaster TaxID=79684 RepID=A0ABM1U8Y7_MICOH|nr:glycerol-3-phosphate dehydrogenase [NAD(+)], cytoplasmic isoform X2 [Microtus ochrogaster]